MTVDMMMQMIQGLQVVPGIVPFLSLTYLINCNTADSLLSKRYAKETNYQ